MKNLPKTALLAVVLFTQGCVTSTVDEVLYEGPEADLGDAAVVILGRRHASDYETEFEQHCEIKLHIAAELSRQEAVPELMAWRLERVGSRTVLSLFDSPRRPVSPDTRWRELSSLEEPIAVREVGAEEPVFVVPAKHCGTCHEFAQGL